VVRGLIQVWVGSILAAFHTGGQSLSALIMLITFDFAEEPLIDILP
jgi:hypothetical protein